VYATLGIISGAFPVKVWCSKGEDVDDTSSFFLYCRMESDEDSGGEGKSEGIPQMIEATVQAVASQYFGTDVVFDRRVMPALDGNAFYKWKITEVPLPERVESPEIIIHELKQKHLVLQYGLSPQQLDKVYPFHIVFDSSLNILQCGEQCFRLISEAVVGSKITDIFDLHSESEQYPLTWGQIQSKLQGEKSPVCDVLSDFCLATTSQRTPLGHPLGLIGELSCSVTDGVAVFLCRPEASSLARMQDLGVVVKDLSKSDKLQLQKDALSDTLHGMRIMDEGQAAHAVSQLKQALTSAQDKLVTKQSFVRYVSHEIRTPLMVVSIGLVLLEKDMKELLGRQEEDITASNRVKLPPGEPSSKLKSSETATSGDGKSQDQDHELVKNSLHTIEECCHSMDVAIGILNDLLAYEKIESGVFHLNKTLVEACDFLKNTIDEFELQVHICVCTYVPVTDFDSLAFIRIEHVYNVGLFNLLTRCYVVLLFLCRHARSLSLLTL
jgi:hypothetical protein